VKPTQLDIKTQGSLGGESIDMSIDTTALAHVMKVLTDLYSDPELAVIREISTNARDANVDAGNFDPIQVTLPNAMSPYFVVKDEGVGLSVDEIRDVYSKYGASTKRNSNDVVGMLGLGCKAPLTYTEQFTVIGIKGGVQTSVAISRKADGTGVMQVVDTSSTDQPNGVTVTVPVKNPSRFQTKAQAFYKYWTPGTVKVNGNDPNFVSGQKVTDKIIIVDGIDVDKIVMGNVNYPLSSGHYLYSKTISAPYHFVYFADIGEVNFPPSREELMYTKLTESTIAKVQKDIKENLHRIFLEDINKADNHTDAFYRSQKWTSKFGRIDWHYKGNKFYTTFDNPIPCRSTSSSLTLFDTEGNVLHNTTSVFQNRTGLDSTIVLNFTGKMLSKPQRDKFEGYCEDNDIKFHDRRMYFFDKDPDVVWWEGVPRLDWNVVKKWKPKNYVKPTPTPRREKVYSILSKNRYDVSMSETDLKAKAKVYYFTPGQLAFYSRRNSNLEYVKDHLTSFYPDATIIRWKKGDEDKLLKKFPNAINIIDQFVSDFNDIQRSLDDADKATLAVRAYHQLDPMAWARKLNPARIDDPAVVDFINNSKQGTQTVRAVRWSSGRKLAQLVQSAGIKGFDPIKSDASFNVHTPLDNYGLLIKIDRYATNVSDVMNQIYVYMNAYYKEIS